MQLCRAEKCGFLKLFKLNLRLILAMAFVCLAISDIDAQIKIGNIPENIDDESLLQLEGSDKALVIPHLTTSQ